jgi:hypothetical protein
MKRFTVGDFRKTLKNVPDNYTMSFAQSACCIEDDGIDALVCHKTKSVYIQAKEESDD